jgi:tRNA(fMet)-specific endonuclease VapC
LIANTAQEYLPDTSILVHYGRQSSLYQRISVVYPLAPTDPKPTLSIVTVGEILSFARQAGWGEVRKQRAEEFLARSIVYSLEHPGIIDAYIELDVESRRLGRKMGDNDLWIAATARATGAILLTTDKDFDHLHPTFILREWIDPTLT